MTRPHARTPALVQAAQDLEAELRRCEDAVAEAAETRLNSEKNIGRAARALQAAAERRGALGEKVNALLAAIKEAQGRTETTVARMEARAIEVQARIEARKALQARGDEIAADVREVAALAKEGAERKRIAERIAAVEIRVAAVLEEARAAEFVDVAHDVDGLRQMLASLRRKLKPGGA
ncbi:MAG: hypothetical protein FD180_3872 [Planctomycetota bacterium]|nr:MAG: hypothetical protein FD180_3872 [Planctomycetota bacterium]